MPTTVRFYSSDDANNPKPENFSADSDFETYHNNRWNAYTRLNCAEDILMLILSELNTIMNFHVHMFIPMDINYLDRLKAEKYLKLLN